MSDTSRKKAIENLETLKAFLDINGVFTISDAMKKSIDFAIASLKTDEAYQLEYERTTKNNLGVSSGLKNESPIIDWNNCHTSEQLDSIATTKNDLGIEKIVDVLGSYTDLDIPYKREIAENILTKLSSVTPQPRVDFKELKRKILMEVDGGTDDAWLAYGEVCDRISNSIDEFVADMREVKA